VPPLIGVEGVGASEVAWERMRGGASQLYTGWIY